MDRDSPMHSPMDVSEDLFPLPSPKTAGQTQFSFSGHLDPPLVLHEDLKDGCGGQAWPAGMLLTRFLLRKKYELRGKTMLALFTIMSTPHGKD